ncbi:MAG: hypothetical protein P8Y67_00165 [Alphaproteobacteria bacterium]
MRVFRLVLGVVISMMLVAAATGAEAQRLKNEILLKKSGVAGTARDISQSLISVFDTYAKKNKLKDVGPALRLLQKLIPQAYDSKKILAIVDDELSKELTDYEKKQLISFYSSRSTKRIVQKVNVATGRVSKNVQKYLKQKISPPADRVTLYQDIIKARGLLDDALSMMRVTYVAIPGAIMKAMKVPANMDDMARQYLVAERRLKSTFEQYTYVIYVRALKDVPINELEEYLNFLQSPVGSRYIALKRKLLTEALMVQTDELANRIIGSVKGGKNSGNKYEGISDNGTASNDRINHRGSGRAVRDLKNKELLINSNAVEFAKSFPALVIAGFNATPVANRDQRAQRKQLMRYVKRLAPVAYSHEKVLAIIDDALDEELRPGQKRQLLNFFTSELGKRLFSAERSTMRLMLRNPRKIGRYIQRHNVDPFRDGLYREIMEANGALEDALSMNRIMNVAIPAAVMTALKRPVNPEDMQRQYLRRQKQMLQQAQQNIYAAYVYAYRNISNEELESYLNFVKSSVGKRFVAVSRKLWAEALMIQTDEFAKMLIDEIGVDPTQIPGAVTRISP